MKRSTSPVMCFGLIVFGAIWLTNASSGSDLQGTAHAGPPPAAQTKQPIKQTTVPPNTSAFQKNQAPQPGGPDAHATTRSLTEANSHDNTLPQEGTDEAFDTVEEQTQRYIEQARKHFSEQNYKLAIEELQIAYKLIPKAIFLFNIAQSYRRKGDKSQALEYYKKFIALDPKNRHANEANIAIVELSAFLKQQDLMEKERRRPVWKRGWFWAILGTAMGGAVIATGVAVGLRANNGTSDTRGPIVLSFN